MEMFVVSGGRPLKGRVSVSGAKNAALPIMAATLLADGPVTLHNVPQLVDVATLARVLVSLGMKIHGDTSAALHFETHDDSNVTADYELVRRMRASICVLGPLLARRKRACVSLPGGCNIGHRPIDLHLKGLRAMGAEITIENGYVYAEAERLRGADIYLGGAFGSTVTGTCNIMSAAVLAEGTTRIEAAACEPEVVDLGNFLNSLGAHIQGLGTPFLTIEGVERLSGGEYRVAYDRIEAATLMIAAGLTRGVVELEQVPVADMTAVIETLTHIGLKIDQLGPLTIVDGRGLRSATDLVALPYPGIPTDVQAQMMSLMSVTPGMSVITDRVFPDRFMHASELVRMGAQIRREGPTAVVQGVEHLSGAHVMASDLRASAALVLAALAAEGETVIRRIYHLDRGYERLDDKLNSLGASIRRVDDQPVGLTTPEVPMELSKHRSSRAA
ncbi:MAG: UDP-N-acetylglucosamine 1-carboxyvinyltransferase [Planctomycetaceae bacterium]|nr:UDP-N-acetylglucosamine 1-carboxyvinyltransferase [Planctomycetaceae bacterium]